MTTADLVWGAAMGLSLPNRIVTAALARPMMANVPNETPAPRTKPLLSALLRVRRRAATALVRLPENLFARLVIASTPCCSRYSLAQHGLQLYLATPSRRGRNIEKSST